MVIGLRAGETVLPLEFDILSVKPDAVNWLAKQKKMNAFGQLDRLICL